MTVVIQRKRQPSGYLIPAGGEIVWYGLATALPPNWVIDSYCSNVFIRGAGAGGSTNTPASDNSHSHTNPAQVNSVPDHAHSIPSGNASAASGTATVYPSGTSLYAGVGHGHSWGATNTGPGGTHVHTLANTVVADAYPPYKRLYWIKATADVMLPIGGIIMFDNPIAQRPNGSQLCNGANGTPDLRDKFIYGAAVDGDVNATGGSDTHVHGNANTGSGGSHSHSVSINTGGSGSSSGVSGYAAGVDVSAGNHSHGSTGSTTAEAAHTHTLGNTGAGTSLPPYLKLYFVMRTV